MCERAASHSQSNNPTKLTKLKLNREKKRGEPSRQKQERSKVKRKEKIQTDKIQKQFDKYLPSVIDGNAPAKEKATLTEAKEVTGNKEESNVRNGASNSATDNVVDIRRLAGLK